MLTGNAPKPGCSAAVPLVSVIDPPGIQCRQVGEVDGGAASMLG